MMMMMIIFLIEILKNSQCESELLGVVKQLQTSGVCGDGTSVIQIPRCQFGRSDSCFSLEVLWLALKS